MNHLRFLAITLAFVGLSSQLQADEELHSPLTQPLWRVIRVEDPKQIIVEVLEPKVERREVQYTVNVPVTSKKVVDGREVTVTELKQETRTRVVSQLVNVPKMMPIKTFALYRLDGKRIEGDALEKLLGETLPVLVIRQGQKVDAFFKHVLKDDTILLMTNESVRRVINPPPPPRAVPRP